MKISTKGRYALRVMADLAEQEQSRYVPLKDIAERQEISQKYLESIMSVLSKNGFVDTLHGKGGGYRLSRRPSEYKVIDILKITEKSMAPVACMEEGAEPCGRRGHCKTLPLWKEFDAAVEAFFRGYTLEDVVKGI